MSDDEQLQEAFAKGELKPGLNIAVEKKKHVNNVSILKNKLNDITLKLPWIERLDLVNTPAPMAPELALQMQEQEIRRSKQLKGNKKLPQYAPNEDPVINEFKRETMFHRQAQAAVIQAVAKLKKLNVPIIRPDDYFAEMAKDDNHMQKVREKLLQKEKEAERSEKVRQIRAHRKIGKQMKIQAELKKHEEKRKMLQEVKRYTKGKRGDLNFLDDKKSNKSGNKKRTDFKQKKFGYGGKKRGSKKNTKESASDISEYRRPSKPGMKKNSMTNKRPGKNTRLKMKARRR